MTREEREATVDWFAEQMKAKLREPRNEAKGGWREESVWLLLGHLKIELEELEAELSKLHRSHSAIIDECCDVAAFSMMLADGARMLKEGS